MTPRNPAARPATEPRRRRGFADLAAMRAEASAPPPGGWKTPGDPSIDGTDFDWAEAAQGAAPLDKTPFQRVVDDLTEGDGCACHTGTGYNSACRHCQPQMYPEGAAPRAEGPCRHCDVPWLHEQEGYPLAAPRADEIRWHHHGDCPHNGEVEGAAPRAEGLPDAPVAVRDALHATFRPATPRGEPITEEWLDVFTESLAVELRKRDVGFARLSRPSDERVPESEEPRA